MHPRAALYYPYIHVRDETWLKHAALYWPRLARLWPEGYPGVDSPAVNVLRHELKWIVDVDPGWAAQQAAAPFLDLVGTHAPELRQRFGLPPEDDRRARAGLGYVHILKVPPRLLDALVDAGLAEPAHRADGSIWLGMHPELVAVYTCALIERVATHNDAHPVTDRPLAHAALSGWTLPRLAEVLLGDGQPARPPGRDDPLDLFVLTAFETVVPADLDRVPIDKIVELRQKFGTELQALREYVTEKVAGLSELAEVEDVHLYRAYLEDEVRATVAAELDQLREHLRSIGLESAKALVNIKSPLALPPALAAVAALAGVPPEVAGAVALSAAVVGVPARWRAERDKAVRDSPIGYLLRTERELSAGGLVQQVRRALTR